MQSKSPSRLFLALGIILAFASITLSLIPKKVIVINDENFAIVSDSHKIKTVTTNTYFGNSEFGTLAAAIISATCFLIAGSLIKEKRS